MGMLEYFLEQRNPRNVGEIKKNSQSLNRVSMPLLLLKLFISILIIIGLFSVTVMQNFNIKNCIIFTTLLLVYCVISYQYIPRPDYSNMGLMGGLLDHPFRYSDDLNRMLQVLLILMYPGRFITTTVIQTYMILRKTNKK